MSLKISHDPLYLVGQKKIVGVEQSNNVAPARGERGIKSRSLPPVCLADEVHPRILPFKLLDHLD